MRPLLLPATLALATLVQAQQLPIIDYDFLAVPPSSLVNKVVVQPDGKILVGGSFTNYAGSGKQNLVRLNSDGTVDPAWNPGGIGPNHLVSDIDLMPDGRILIAGNFVTYNGSPVYFVARLLPNGLRDASFNIPPNSINNAVNAVALHKDNKVVAAGDFFICYGHSQPYITRFNEDGSLDLDFDIGTGFNDAVYDLHILPDESILCAGKFTQYNGNMCGRVALLSSAGPYDPSMDNDPGLVGGPARALAMQPDGKLLVAGSFNYHDGQPANGLIRLNLDGTRDAGFASPFYPYASVRAVNVLPDGHIMAGGEYTSTMYSPNVGGPNRLTMLQANGSRDDGFGLGQGILPTDPDNTAFVRSIAVQNDGKILVGGRFGFIDTEMQYRQLVRLKQGVTGILEQDPANVWNVIVDHANGELVLADPFHTSGKAHLLIHNGAGQLVHQAQVSVGGGPVRIKVDLAPGLHLISLQQGGQRVAAKVVW
ncbi:MAG TPA: delta-60 repeat domain-containing protein [Flavobacteriales bacterium]|nr:delta-60 repeat domain-containing protein [Flavobacteriales bacterium]